MAFKVDITGVLAISPPTGSPSASGVATFAYRKTRYATFQQSGSFSTSAGDNAIDLGAITNVRGLYFQADTPCVLKVTWADGTNEAIPLDGVVMFDTPNTPVTGLTINGASTGTFALVGD